jgi:hypothetical protein
MTKPADTLLEDTDTVVISDVSVPDMASLGWPPADHVFISVEGQQAVGDFYSLGEEVVEDASIIEFTVEDLPANSVLADLENQDLGIFDLNNVLGQTDTVPGGRILPGSNTSDTGSADTETAPQADLSPSDVHHLSVNMALPHLTIVIDDESGSNTVAI